MSKVYPRRRCKRCKYFARGCECGGLCGLKIEYLRWLGDYPEEEPLTWVSLSSHCSQYKKVVQLDLPL